jgi:hypothetical protein
MPLQDNKQQHLDTKHVQVLSFDKLNDKLFKQNNSSNDNTWTLDKVIGELFNQKYFASYVSNHTNQINASAHDSQILLAKLNICSPLVGPTHYYDADTFDEIKLTSVVCLPLYDCAYNRFEMPDVNKLKLVFKTKQHFLLPFTFIRDKSYGHYAFLFINVDSKRVFLVDSNGMTNKVVHVDEYEKLEVFFSYFFKNNFDFTYIKQSQWIPKEFDLNRDFKLSHFKTGHCVSLSYLLMTLMTKLQSPSPAFVFDQLIKSQHYLQNDKLISIIKSFTVQLCSYLKF